MYFQTESSIIRKSMSSASEAWVSEWVDTVIWNVNHKEMIMNQLYAKGPRWVLRSAAHSNTQPRSWITKSTHFEIFKKKKKGKLGLREIYICKLQVKQITFIFTA